MRPSSMVALECALVSLAIGFGAAGDSISAGGKTYEDVYVIQSATGYYVQIPADGRVLSFPKTSVDPKSIAITQDAAARQALLEQWKRSNRRLHGVPDPTTESSQPTNGAHEAAPPQAAPSAVGQQAGSPKHVPAKTLEELRAALRAKGLDCEVIDGRIRVSTPEKLRTQPDEPLETRTYSLKNLSGETLPKTVLRMSAMVPQQAGGAFGSAVGGAYSTGPGAYGSALGGATGGGYSADTGAYAGGNANASSSGVAGGYGGGLAPGRMGGFAGGGYVGGGGDFFPSITDFFSGFDDRIVGEAPAHIDSFLFLER